MSEERKYFRTEFAESIFNHKYKHEKANTWKELSETLIEDVCRDYISQEDKEKVEKLRETL